MAMIQSNFVDRMNDAEAELASLVTSAEQLASRLVGYADETSEPSYEGAPVPSGILPEMMDRASRMAKKTMQVRRSLQRISEALPPETVQTAGNKAYIG